MNVFLILLLALGQAASPKPTKPPKNSDIENIGKRDINKGNLNFMSLGKEIAVGQELAREERL